MDLISILFSLIKTVLLNEEMDDDIKNSLDDTVLQNLFAMSKSYDIAPIVGTALEKINYANSEWKEKFVKQQITAVYRYEKSVYELNRISSFLNDNDIAFIPLKGSVLRKYYPQPWMRTSCDIDILIHEEDLELAKELLIQKLGYKFHSFGNHDVGLYSPSGVHIELHYSLMQEKVTNKADVPLRMVWEHAISTEKYPMMYEMSKEMFYYYHLAHMAKHFMVGGCGLRPFVDLFIIRSKFEIDEHQKNELLLRGGLLKFAEQAEALCGVWFCGDNHSALTLDMQDYLLQGGVYGSMQNRVAIQQVQRGGKFRYAISRIWIPLDKLKFQYPILNKHRWLMPVCEVRRWFKLVFGGSLRKARKEFKTNSNLNADKVLVAKELLNQLEL